MTPPVAVAERPALKEATEAFERGDFAVRARDGVLVQVLEPRPHGRSVYYTCETQDGAVTVLWHGQLRLCPRK